MSADGTPRQPGQDQAAQGGIPIIVTAARWLFVCLGLIWLGFGVWNIMRIAAQATNAPVALLWIVGILMFVNALLLCWIGWGIGRGNRLYFYFGLLLLAVNVFFTFTDQFGAFDLLTLIINLVLMVLLVAGHSKFLHN
jgi:hypothetical protein